MHFTEQTGKLSAIRVLTALLTARVGPWKAREGWHGSTALRHHLRPGGLSFLISEVEIMNDWLTVG